MTICSDRPYYGLDWLPRSSRNHICPFLPTTSPPVLFHQPPSFPVQFALPQYLLMTRVSIRASLIGYAWLAAFFHKDIFIICHQTNAVSEFFSTYKLESKENRVLATVLLIGQQVSSFTNITTPNTISVTISSGQYCLPNISTHSGFGLSVVLFFTFSFPCIYVSSNDMTLTPNLR